MWLITKKQGCQYSESDREALAYALVLGTIIFALLQIFDLLRCQVCFDFQT